MAVMAGLAVLMVLIGYTKPEGELLQKGISDVGFRISGVPASG
jgi:hypothetical protein